MAKSGHQSAIAFPAEVARYLLLDPEDVARLIELDGLPALSIPKATRKVTRINLRDLYSWLVVRTKNPPANLTDYETFLADFNISAGRKTAA